MDNSVQRPVIFKCFKCSSKFINDKSLTLHILICHKIHECIICHKVFTLKRNLVRHKKEHTQRKYICEFCKISFHRKEHKDRHLVKHNSVKFSCSVCGKTFTRKDNYRKHFKSKHKFNVSTN